MTQNLLCLNNVILKDALGFLFDIQKAWSLQVFFFLKKLSVCIVLFNVDEVLYMFKQNH